MDFLTVLLNGVADFVAIVAALWFYDWYVDEWMTHRRNGKHDGILEDQDIS